MRTLEIAVWGISDEREAGAALQRQLEKLIVVEPGGATKLEQ